jgi:hypothetical protein
MLGWPLLNVAAALVWPPDPDATRAQLVSAAAQQGAWLVASTLFALSFLFLIPGLVSALGIVTGRGRRLTLWGAALAVPGVVGDVVAGFVAIEIGVLAAQPDRTAMLAALEGIERSPAAIFIVLLLLGHVGLMLFTAGLRRARVVGLWVPLAAVAGMTVDLLVKGKIGQVLVAVIVSAVVVGIARALWQAGNPTGTELVGG